MTIQQSTQALAAQLLSLARDGKIEQLEEIWIEQIGALPAQGAFYKEWGKVMRRAGALDRAESLLAMALEERLDQHKFKSVMRILLAILAQYPQSDLLRPVLLRAIRGFYQDLEMREEILKLTDLAGSASLPEGFQAFQEWVRLTPGQVYQHYDWGEGIVQALDPAAGKVTLAFPTEPNKVMTIDGVKKHLKHIAPTHFLAQRAKDAESLLKLAESEPAELVKLILHGQPQRRIKQAELKTLLTPSILGPEQWNGWWSKAREALKLDPYIDFDSSGGAHTLIALREEPRTFEQEIEESFFAEDAGTALKAELIRQMSKRAREVVLAPSLVQRMGERLLEDWRLSVDERPAVRLEIAYMLEDLAALPAAKVNRQGVDDQSILDAIADYAVLAEMENVDYGIRALNKLLARDGAAGRHQAAELLPRASVKMAQAIWLTLDEQSQQDLAVAAIEKLFNNPLGNPETFAWAARSVLDGSWAQWEDFFHPATVVLEILEDMELWQRIASEGGRPAEQVAAVKTLLTKMRAALGANKYEAIARAVQGQSREAVQRLRHMIQVHGALASAFKSQADRIIGLTRKDLDEVQSQKDKFDDLHYCTARAHHEKLLELREITSAKIPKNSKIIEEARMEGDLKENAGYQYAKEEQKMLVQQQASLTEMLSRALVIQAKDVDPSTIKFGTTFRVHNIKLNQAEEYTILGRWEANPERHILSMQAPLAQQFMGHRVGETVRIDHPGGGSTNYEILEIANALASGEWEIKEG